jgi:hypothetical protein
MKRFLLLAALLLSITGRLAAQDIRITPGPLYPPGFNSIDATQKAGADMCAKISAAATALAVVSPSGGTIDARGFLGTQACAASMFASWPAAPFSACVLLGNGWISTLVAQTPPANGSICASSPWGAASGQAAYVVATAGSSPPGNDSNTGTLAAPLLTLTAAQTKSRASGPKLIYVRAGSYAPATITGCGGGDTNGLCLTSADAGETWSYFPPDGYNTADITGGGVSAGTPGLTSPIRVTSTSNITWNGIQVHNYDYAGIFSDTSNGITIKNSIFYNQYRTCASGGNPAGVSAIDSMNLMIANNVVHDVACFGYSNLTGGAGTYISNTTYMNNVVYNYCTSNQDCGGYYFQDISQTSSNLIVKNNYARDGCPACAAPAGAKAVYFDNGAGNGVISGNIFKTKNAFTFEVYATRNVLITGNIFDLGTDGAMDHFDGVTTGSVIVQGNIFIGAPAAYTYPSAPVAGGGGNAAVTLNNLYWPYVNAANWVDIRGLAGEGLDSNWVNADPLLSGCFVLSPTSPAFNAPVSFPYPGPNTSTMGYPGYVIPNTGTASSYASPTC